MLSGVAVVLGEGAPAEAGAAGDAHGVLGGGLELLAVATDSGSLFCIKYSADKVLCVLTHGKGNSACGYSRNYEQLAKNKLRSQDPELCILLVL